MDYTYSQRTLTDDLHIQLFIAEAIRIDATWNSRNVQSAYWRLYLNEHDGAWLDLAGGRFPLDGGRLYFVPAGVTFTCGNGPEIEHFYVHFDLVGYPPVLLQELLRVPIPVPDDPDLLGRVRDIVALLRGARADLAMQCRIKAAIYEAFSLAIAELGRDAVARSEAHVAGLGPVMPALRRIERDLGERLDNSILANACCMSEDHFIRRFRAAVGKTPARYLTERRITIAAQQLRFTTRSIESIAEQTGFGNRFYFTRVFARELGITPARYRLGEPSSQ